MESHGVLWTIAEWGKKKKKSFLSTRMWQMKSGSVWPLCHILAGQSRGMHPNRRRKRRPGMIRKEQASASYSRKSKWRWDRSSDANIKHLHTELPDIKRKKKTKRGKKKLLNSFQVVKTLWIRNRGRQLLLSSTLPSRNRARGQKAMVLSAGEDIHWRMPWPCFPSLPFLALVVPFRILWCEVFL